MATFFRISRQGPPIPAGWQAYCKTWDHAPGNRWARTAPSSLCRRRCFMASRFQSRSNDGDHPRVMPRLMAPRSKRAVCADAGTPPITSRWLRARHRRAMQYMIDGVMFGVLKLLLGCGMATPSRGCAFIEIVRTEIRLRNLFLLCSGCARVKRGVEARSIRGNCRGNSRYGYLLRVVAAFRLQRRP